MRRAPLRWTERPRKGAAGFQDEEKARKLFGANMHVSATQIETLYLCRFQYFCRYGLRAKERRTAEMMHWNTGA